MAGGRACIRERLAGLRLEDPVVARLVQRQPEDAVGRLVPDLAVRSDGRERRVVRPARADDELADAPGRVERAVRALRRESLVNVVVTGEDEVGVVVVEDLPQRARVRGGPTAGAEQ